MIPLGRKCKACADPDPECFKQGLLFSVLWEYGIVKRLNWRKT